MEMIEEYGICSAHDHLELLKYVDEQLKHGYQPWGSPYTTVQYNVLFIHQTMVKYNLKKKT